ncbi:MAG: hypothetical protein GY926_14845 [bacterium]|nr:hypothetical protein [bacterium]
MTIEQWFPVLTLLVGAAAGFGAGLLRDAIDRRHHRRQADTDRLRQLVAQSLNGAQWCGSIISHIASLDIDREALDSPEHLRTRNDLSSAISSWNTANHELHLISDRRLVLQLRAIDEEISTLYTQALTDSVSAESDHENRQRLGRLLAGYLDEARRLLSDSGARLDPLDLPTLWSWRITSPPTD